MIFNVSKTKNKFIEDCHKESMKELDNFFELNWKFNTPKIFLLKKREDIDILRDGKTEGWLVAWANNRNIFLLEKNQTGKESDEKYSPERYKALIKHEICHLFIDIVARNKKTPVWLNEGLCIFLSGQLKFKNRPEKFSEFLEYYDKSEKSVYRQSGYFVELLINKFGREKLMKLLKSPGLNDYDKFKKAFKTIYGFSLNYREINKIYKERV